MQSFITISPCLHFYQSKIIKFLVVCALGLTGLLTNMAEAQTKQFKDTFMIKKENSFYPSISMGRSFNSNDLKAGINLIMYNYIAKYKKNHDTNNLMNHIPKQHGCNQISRQEWTFHNSVEYISVFTLNHHFIKDNFNRTINSQSIEYAIFCDNVLNTIIGAGLQVKHYNFETISISPQIKILPPFINLYAQMNLHQETRLSIPKYEIGIEFNPRFLYEIGKYLLDE